MERVHKPPDITCLVRKVSRKEFVCSLPVQHDFHVFLGEPHHAVLGIDGKRPERFVLHPDKPVDIIPQLCRIGLGPVGIDTGGIHDLINIPALIEPFVGEYYREGLLPVADTRGGLVTDEVVDEDRKGRGVDPPGKAGADSNIASQVDAGCVLEQVEEAAGFLFINGI